MLAISSIKPFSQDLAYGLLQQEAISSWARIFNEIILVSSNPEPSLDKLKITMIIADCFPPIHHLSLLASSSVEPYVAIINSDIYLTEELKLVEALLNKSGSRCATSRRWNYAGDVQSAQLHPGDNGLDIFMATPDAWAYVSGQIPVELRLGIPGWDNWLVRCFHKRYGHSFRNFTRWRCCFHPLHSPHERPHAHQVQTDETDLPHIKEL
jgi:hypothetical protein